MKPLLAFFRTIFAGPSPAAGSHEADAGAALTVPDALPAGGALTPQLWPWNAPIPGINGPFTLGADMNDRRVTLTEGELEDLIQKAVARALRDVGIIATDDESIEKRRRDFTFLHDLRKQKESLVGKIAAAIVTAVMAGVCVLLALGFKNWMRL